MSSGKDELLADAARTVDPTPPPVMKGASSAMQGSVPDDIAGMIKKAMAHHQAGELGPAAMLYWGILDQNPDHVDALHLGGLVAHETGDDYSAVKMISRAVELSPQVGFFHNNLGNVYFDCDRLEEACESFRRAIEVKPDFAHFHFNLGNCLLRLQEAVGAEAAFRHALALQPDLLAAARGLGEALLAQQQFAAAEPWFRQVLQADPDDQQAADGVAAAMAAQDPGQIAPAPLKASATPQYGQAIRQPEPGRATGISVPDDVRQQIADRLLRHEPPETIAASLIAGGLGQDMVRHEIQAALDHPYLKAGYAVATRLKKRDWVLNTYRTLDNLLPATVERKYRLSRHDFLRDHYSANRPVVIQGAMDNWAALQKWTPEYLREHYGHLTVEIQAGRNADRNYETNMQKLKRDVKFAEYIDMITGASTNDVYMTANNTSSNRETLKGLWEDVDQLPEYLDPESSDKGFLWIGPAGTITPLHHDLTNNFMAQVRGRKHVKLISAFNLPHVYNHLHCYSELDLTNIDYGRFPLLRNARIMDVILEPGDVLFLPIGCWHYVKGLEMSITMSFTHFRFNNDFHSFYDTYHEL
jgi:tetratricopeptide (TPR) repeat protein